MLWRNHSRIVKRPPHEGRAERGRVELAVSIFSNVIDEKKANNQTNLARESSVDMSSSNRLLN